MNSDGRPKPDKHVARLLVASHLATDFLARRAGPGADSKPLPRGFWTDNGNSTADAVLTPSL